MTRERRYVLDSRVRSPSPQRRTLRYRDFSLSRRQEYSSYQRNLDDLHATDGMQYTERSRRTETRDHFDRDLDLLAVRFSDYHDRDRDRDRDKDRERERECDSYRYKDGVGHSRRLYGEDSLIGDSASMKFRQNYGLDNPRNSDGFNVKDNVNDYRGGSDTNITRVSGEKDYYPGSKYLDEGQSRLPAVLRYLGVSKPSPLETERTQSRYTDSYALDHAGVDGLPKSLGGYDIGARQAPSSELQYLITDTHEDGDFNSVDELHLAKKGRDIHSRDNCHFNKKDGHFHPGDELINLVEYVRPIDREMYKYNREDNLLSLSGYLSGDVDHTMSSSRPKDYAKGSSGFSSREDLYVPLPSDGTRMKTGMTSETIGLDGGSGEKSQNRSPMTSQDITSYSRSYFGSLERHGAHIYPEFGRSHMGSSSTRSSGKTLMDVKEYGGQDTSRTDFMYPVDVIDESSRIRLEDIELWNHHASSRGELTHNYSDARGFSYARDQDDKVLGCGSTHLSYDRELYHNYGSIEPREIHSNEMDGGPWTHEERSDVLQLKEYDPCLDRIDNSFHKRLAERDLSSVKESETKIKQNHFMGEKLHKHDVSRKSIRSSYHPGRGGEDVDPVSLSDKFKSRKYDYANTSESGEMANYQSSCEKFIANHSNNHHKSGARDIKKRLGPRPQKLHVSQRIVKKYKPSLEKRLGPPPKIHDRLPWLKKISSKKFPRVQDDSDGNPDDIVGDQLEDNVRLEKPEPPEKSDEFKQLVQSAFFKFLKQTSETPTKMKKYKEQVKTYSLKCLVCGSNSDNFADTESLAMHAFTSTKVGFRSQHLGLHKALCVLMGWKSAEDFSSQWLSEVLSDAETSSIKEDLIIWPPVVIIYNSTIGKKNPDEQVILSTEALESKLKDMGFGNISKVCIGKPANQSVMLAIFNGTLSGLQEAERLHKNYLETKHGRMEFMQVMSSEKGSCSEETQTVSAEKEEKFLYCYLGLLEDLDKLDFITKKRCVVRSKREIQSIAEAPINTKGEHRM